MPTKRLYRSQTDRMVAGVCGGLGEYFEIDSIIFRLIFVLFTIGAGSGILLYLLAWILMPDAPGAHRVSEEKKNEPLEETIESRVKEVADKVEKAAGKIHTSRNNSMGGLILLVIGVLFLLQNLTGFDAWGNFWPLILIVLGLSVILKSAEHRN